MRNCFDYLYRKVPLIRQKRQAESSGNSLMVVHENFCPTRWFGRLPTGRADRPKQGPHRGKFVIFPARATLGVWIGRNPSRWASWRPQWSPLPGGRSVGGSVRGVSVCSAIPLADAPAVIGAVRRRRP